MRQINQAGIDLLKRFEGCRLTNYYDSAGINTIGIGHTGPDVTANMTITSEQAEELLKKDLEHTYKIESYLRVPVSDNQYSALICLAFNIGTNAFKTSQLLRSLNAGEDVKPHWLKWNHIHGVVSFGLTRRREAEVSLYKTPVENQQAS